MKRETHFNDKVPQELRDKLETLAETVKSDFIADVPGWPEALGTANIDEIYGYHISGFIPNQLGGYEVTELYRHDCDATYHFTAAQTDTANKQYEHMIECFAGDNDLPVETVKDWEALTDEQQEALSEYENEWFEPALLRFTVWVDKKDGPSYGLGNNDVEPEAVYCALALAYSDAPYYRRNSDDETLAEFSYSVAEFMALEPEAIIKRLREAVEGAA